MEITSENFAKVVLESKKPVIVEFMWNFSSKCKMMSHRIEKVLESIAAPIDHFQIDIYKNSDMRDSFRIRDIPTFYFYYRGEIISSISGIESESVFETEIQNLIDLTQKETKKTENLI